MAGPLHGIRVLELANWLAVPSATALMADLGADVVKVEPPAGDVSRGTGDSQRFAIDYGFQLSNRGKRSVAIDLESPRGSELLRRLIGATDIFATNLTAGRIARYGLRYEDVRVANPRLVYAGLSAYGSRGPDANRPGYDSTSYWARSGIMSITGEADEPPVTFRGGSGDQAVALNVLAAVLAALRLRDQTGEGQHVEVTLQATGMWAIGRDVAVALGSNEQPARITRKNKVNPISNSTYRCADGRWLLLANPTPFPKAWPAFCELVGRPEWVCAYDELPKLRAHANELAKEIETIIEAHELDHWRAKLDASGLIWAPVATVPEVIHDPQVREMDWITTIESQRHGRFETLSTPFHIYGADIGPTGAAPEVGEHSYEVLAAWGVEPAEITEFAAARALG